MAGKFSDEVLAKARDLVASLETGDDAASEKSIDFLAKQREQDMFVQIGRLTRDLHDAIENFQVDTRFTTLAKNEIPDAKERLNYVIKMTEEAANTTMNAVEKLFPIAEAVEQHALSLDQEWQRFRTKNMSADDFRAMSKDIDSFLPSIAVNSTEIRSKLNEVLMAQGFQDLTGQVIRKVIGLVTEVENKLVELIKISCQHLRTGDEPIQSEADGKKESAFGPVVPGVDDRASDTVSGQDEVDDLLSSLGF